MSHRRPMVQYRKENKLCIDCGSAELSTKRRCKKHAAAHSAYSSLHRKNHKAKTPNVKPIPWIERYLERFVL